MTQNVPLNKNDIAIEPFFDAVQELLSGAAPYFVVTVLNTTTLRLAAGTGHSQQSIAIDGYYRFRSANVDAAHPAGVAGTYDVYVTTGNNDFTGAPPNIDVTNYAFGFEIRASGSTPTTAHWRKVGETDWSGTAITGFRQLVGTRHDDAPLTPTAPLPGINPLRVRGASAHTALLGSFESNAGVVKASVAADGTVNSAIGYLVAGTPLAASHLSNGTTGTGQVALQTSPQLLGVPTAPTPAVDLSNGQVATTGFVLGQASGATPLMDGTPAVGTALRWAHGDHVHPVDTSRATVTPGIVLLADYPRTGGETDDTGRYSRALTAGMTAYSAGFVLLQPAGQFSVTSLPSMQNKQNITLRGMGGRARGGGTATTLVFTGTGARFIDWRMANGCILVDMDVQYTNPAFSGTLVDWRGPAGQSNVTGGALRCSITGTGSANTANELVAIANCHSFVFDQVMFERAVCAIRGKESNLDFCNAITLRDVYTTLTTQAPIQDLGEGCVAIDPVAEPLADNSAGWYKTNPALGGSRGLTVLGGWFGDTNGTGRWVDYTGSGFNMIGGLMDSAGTAIKFGSNSYGCTVHGVVFDSNTLVFDVGTNCQHMDLIPNYFATSNTSIISLSPPILASRIPSTTTGVSPNGDAKLAGTWFGDQMEFEAYVAAYRNSANAAVLGRTGNGVPGPGVAFGSTLDTNVYRSAPDTLASDDDFIARRTQASQVLLGGVGGVAGVALGLTGDTQLVRDSSARLKLTATVPTDTGAVLRNTSATGFTGFQLNDQADVPRAFMGWANDAVAANQYMRLNSGTNPLRLMYNATTLVELGASALRFFGGTPATKPVATADIKAGLASLGLLTAGGASPLNLEGGTLTAGAIGGALAHTGATAGFFNTTPTTKPGATAEIKGALASLGLLTDGSASPLNLDGGVLTAGDGSFAALSASSGSFSGTLDAGNTTVAGALSVSNGATIIGKTVTDIVQAGLFQYSSVTRMQFDGNGIGFFGAAPTTRRTSYDLKSGYYVRSLPAATGGGGSGTGGVAPGLTTEQMLILVTDTLRSVIQDLHYYGLLLAVNI